MINDSNGAFRYQASSNRSQTNKIIYHCHPKNPLITGLEVVCLCACVWMFFPQAQSILVGPFEQSCNNLPKSGFVCNVHLIAHNASINYWFPPRSCLDAVIATGPSWTSCIVLLFDLWSFSSQPALSGCACGFVCWALEIELSTGTSNKAEVEVDLLLTKVRRQSE